MPPILKPPVGLARATATTPHREIGSASSAGRIAGHHAGGSVSPLWIALAVVVILLLGWPLARILRASVGAEDLLTELERALTRTRRPVADGVTLVALERRLSTSPDAAAYIRALRLARYGGAAKAPTAAQRRALRQELSRGLGLRGSARALWSLPPWLPAHRARLNRDEQF